MKKIKFKKKKFSGITLLFNDAKMIRELASSRGIHVYDMAHQILEEWAGWKEPELKKSLDFIQHKDYN